MRMDLAGERFQVEEHYQVLLPPGNHLIVVAGAHFGAPAYDFDHPNLAAKKSGIADFKHYRESGSKFWTSRAEISFYFAVPKAEIELLPEKGHSYVPVRIGGHKYVLNVSGGGGGDGWTDYVRQVAHLGCGMSCKDLGSLAEIAMSPAECQAQGITMEIEPLDNERQQRFIAMAAAVTMRDNLKSGSQVYLCERYSYGSSRGPFTVEVRPPRKRFYLCESTWGKVRVQYAAIDWFKTAEVNGVSVPSPVLVNRISPVSEPVAA